MVQRPLARSFNFNLQQLHSKIKGNWSLLVRDDFSTPNFPVSPSSSASLFASFIPCSSSFLIPPFHPPPLPSSVPRPPLLLPPFFLHQILMDDSLLAWAWAFFAAGDLPELYCFLSPKRTHLSFFRDLLRCRTGWDVGKGKESGACDDIAFAGSNRRRPRQEIKSLLKRFDKVNVIGGSEAKTTRRTRPHREEGRERKGGEGRPLQYVIQCVLWKDGIKDTKTVCYLRESLLVCLWFEYVFDALKKKEDNAELRLSGASFHRQLPSQQNEAHSCSMQWCRTSIHPCRMQGIHAKKVCV